VHIKVKKDGWFSARKRLVGFDEVGDFLEVVFTGILSIQLASNERREMAKPSIPTT